jgi:oligopeptide transport system substrate-binding protein
LAIDVFSGWCVNQLFSGLLQLTANDELVPDVAQSWEVQDDGCTYIFHLRDDISWSDGEAVTSADFEYAWKRILHPDIDHGLSEILFDIVGAQAFKDDLLDDPEDLGVKATDEYTLVVNLESPSSYFLQLMANAVSKPVPKHVVEHLGLSWSEPANIVTNGPFMLKSLIPGQSMIFERYDGYHGRSKGNLSEVDFRIVPGQTALEMYERDELDILYPYNRLSFRNARRAIQRHPGDYISRPNPMTSFLTFNVTKPPFDDPKVRRALVLAMDRETLANTLIPGLDFPAGGGLVPPGVAGHVPGIALAYDPALARQMLAEAGYPGGQGLSVLEGICAHWAGLSLVSEHLVAMWKANLGLQVAFEYTESLEELDDRFKKNPPDVILRGWAADYPDPDSFLRYSNWVQDSGWSNPQYEALVQDAGSIADQAQRMVMYRQAELILVEEAPVVPVHYDRLHVLVKPWLPGLPASVISGNILKDVIIEEH